MILIDKQRDLDEICLELQSELIMGIDTEFERSRTYFAKLSIIQVTTGGNESIIIDALSEIELSPFEQILSDNKILKIFHSPEQDFEIFYHLFKRLPANVFDTQLAARICNISVDLISYSDLCQQLLNVHIDKSLQRANWLARPLENKLLKYAARDTEFLIPLYELLSNKLIGMDKLAVYQRDLSRLLDANNYKVSIDKLIRKMRIINKSETFESKVYALTSFREECARILDIPRSHCATDHDLIKLCSVLPTSDQELRKVPLDRKRILDRRFKTKLFEMCNGLKEI